MNEKHIKISLLLFTILFPMILSMNLVNVAEVAGSPTWSTYKRLSYTSTETRWDLVAANGEFDPNYIVVAFADNLTGQFDWYFNESTDGGVTWTDPEIAVDPDYDIMYTYLGLWSAAMAMDSDGITHMVWCREKEYNTMTPTGIYYARYNGTSWSDPITIYEDMNPGYLLLYTADIIVGRNNTIHLAYGSDLPGHDNGDIWYSKSLDGGFTWTSPVNINGFGWMDVGYRPSLAADNFGNVYYAVGGDWYSSSWTAEMYFRRSQDNGATWNSQMAIARQYGKDDDPRLMCDDAGGVYAVWSNYSLLFKCSLDHGSNWTPYYGGITLINDVPGMGGYYFAELDDCGFIHIVYQSTATGTAETYYMRIDTSGNIVNHPQIITPDDGYNSRPTGLALTGDQICVTTKDLKDGNWEAYFISLPLVNHDVAVVSVEPESEWLYQGKLCHASVNVTVTNEGEVPENFTVTLYYNITGGDTIGTQPVSNLLPSKNETLTFIWDTSVVVPCHNYTMTAVANIVPGEADITDNTMSSVISIRVRILGDVNNDGKVDIKDIAQAALAFGSFLGHPKWNIAADVNNDDKIDIKDMALIARNFGKSCP